MGKVAPSFNPPPKKGEAQTEEGISMLNLINECDKINVSLNNYSGTKERLPTAEQRLPNQNADDDDFSIFAEPPVKFDSEAEAAYDAYCVVPGWSKYGILPRMSRREGGCDGTSDGQGAIAHRFPSGVSGRGELRGVSV